MPEQGRHRPDKLHLRHLHARTYSGPCRPRDERALRRCHHLTGAVEPPRGPELIHVRSPDVRVPVDALLRDKHVHRGCQHVCAVRIGNLLCRGHAACGVKDRGEETEGFELTELAIIFQCPVSITYHDSKHPRALGERFISPRGSIRVQLGQLLPHPVLPLRILC